jgi:hypothetical protein
MYYVVDKEASNRSIPQGFRKMAVERLKSCGNMVALSEGLGGPRANSRERELR